jgi:hypothetical protein
MYIKIIVLISVVLFNLIIYNKLNNSFYRHKLESFRNTNQNKFIISYPRSGQGLIRRCLDTIHSKYNLDFSYCNFYDCCRTIPCKFGKMYQKNHDNNNDITIDENCKYVVLYRKDYILQLEAHYRYELLGPKKPTEKSKMKINYYNSENLNNLIKFIKNKKKNYDGFINKWVNNENKYILKIEYYDFIQNVDDNLRKIMNFYYPNKSFPENLENSLTEKISMYHKLDEKVYGSIKSKLE